MPDVLITFYCDRADADLVTDTLRPLSQSPLHIAETHVLGHDFGDALTGELVRGALERTAIALVEEQGATKPLVEAVVAARRSKSVRWIITPIVDRGRAQ